MIPDIALISKDETSQAGRSWPRDLILGILPLLVGFEVLFAITYVPLALRGTADFRQLYVGGYMVRTGHARELYNYDTQQRFEEEVVPVRERYLLPINHLAFEEVFFAPMSLLPYRTAYWVFVALNGVLLAICVWLLKATLHAPEQWKWLPALLIASFFPVARALMEGQDSIILLTLLAAALWALDHEREFAAGFLVGIGLFKFQIVIPIMLLFLIWRRWRFSAGFAVSSVAASLASLWLVGLVGAKEYWNMLLSMSLRLSSSADMLRYCTNPREMINLRGLVTAIFDGKLPHDYVQGLVAACSVVVLWMAARQRPSLPLAIAAASLVSYHFIVHDASVLLIVVAAALCSASVWKGAVAGLFLLATLWTVIPAHGYPAAVPLLGLLLLMIERAPDRSALDFRDALAEGSTCA